MLNLYLNSSWSVDERKSWWIYTGILLKNWVPRMVLDEWRKIMERTLEYSKLFLYFTENLSSWIDTLSREIILSSHYISTNIFYYITHSFGVGPQVLKTIVTTLHLLHKGLVFRTRNWILVKQNVCFKFVSHFRRDLKTKEAFEKLWLKLCFSLKSHQLLLFTLMLKQIFCSLIHKLMKVYSVVSNEDIILGLCWGEKV